MRRLTTLLAAGLLAGLFVAACGGDPSASPATSPAASPSTSAGTQVVGPVILDREMTTATVSVGRFVTFSVDDPASWEISATPDGIVKVQKGSDDGSAIFNPAAEALAPGTATVTLTNAAGATLVFTITVE